MAYDKVVDSAVLDSTLTAIADAIREKGGTSDPIAFDAMAAAIAAIEAGGGGAFRKSVTPSEDILAKNMFKESHYGDIYHNLGVIPNLFLVWSEDADASITGHRYGKGFVLMCPDISDYTTYIGGQTYKTATETTWKKTDYKLNAEKVITGTGSGTGGLVYAVDEESMKIDWDSSGDIYAQAGKTYELVVAKI